MKILIIGEVFYPEEFIINDLALELQKEHEVGVLTRTPSYPQDKIYPNFKNKLFQKNDFNGIKVYRFPVIIGYQSSTIKKIFNYINFVFFGTLFGLFLFRKYDRIFIYQTGPLTQALPVVMLNKLYKKKTTIWTQDLWPDTVYAYGFKKNKFSSTILDFIVRSVYKNMDNVLISCKGFENKLKQYFPNKSFHWVPNWALSSVNKSDTKFELKKGFNFTFAGNIGKVQNLENVILGFSKAVFNNSSVYLNIFGDGSNLEKLKELVDSHQIQNVLFWGRKKLEEMPLIFSASDVLIISLTSHDVFKLTIPSKFQAYLNESKPIMGIIAGEVADLINEYKIGLTADPDDINDIADKFKSFIESNKLNEFSKNSTKLNTELFNREKIIKQIESILLS